MKFKSLSEIVSAGILLVIVSTPSVQADQPAITATTTTAAATGTATTTGTGTATAGGNAPAATPPNPTLDTLREAYALTEKGDYDGALAKLNGILQADSQNKDAHMLRATVYAKQKNWDKADYEYDLILVSQPNDTVAKFDQAELKFMQKKYDDARTGFAALQKDPELGDFATYKVFLSDLFGAHEDVAAKELDAINQVGGNPSYYFANAAWDLVHNQTQDARGWLASASRIYANAPQKLSNYAASLTDLGYLPLHTASAQ